MAPKRKTGQAEKVSQSVAKRRFSKRLSGPIANDRNTDVMKPSKKKQLKKKHGRTNSAAKESDQSNDELITDFNSIEENKSSMSVDSVVDTDSSERTSSSMEKSSGSLNNDISLKPSTRRSISMHENDEDEEFRRMFMTKSPKFDQNYNSTPLNASRRHDKDIHSTGISSSSQRAVDTALDRPSNAAANHSLGRSEANARAINTPLASNINDARSQSHSSASIRSPSIVTMGSNNAAILETFVEYRNLKRDLDRAVKQNELWATDYQTLTRRMKRLEQTTFPRPSADGYAFLEQLLGAMKSSQGDVDRRTNAELARDLGLSEATLMTFSHTDPQKTALRVFGALFPTNQEKEALNNATHLSAQFPNLLADILVFARRCSPGTGYNETMLKDAIGNSIRCARHNLRRMNLLRLAAAAAIQPPPNPDAEHI